jgi:DNA-directed RNA polymerase subunit F
LRKFIRRHKEVGYYGERYLNFIAALRRVVKSDPNEAKNLREEIVAMPVLAEKEWLLEQTGT